MSMGELTAPPDSFSAGSTVVYRRSLPDYPASAGFVLALHLRGPGALDVEADADGDDFVVTLKGSETADLAAGDYTWLEDVDDGSGDGPWDVGGPGTLIVTANLRTAAPGDLQSPDEAELAQVRAQIAKILESGIQRYGVDATQVEHPDLKALYARQAFLERRIARRRDRSALETIAIGMGRL
jgi:hypothetical protein